MTRLIRLARPGRSLIAGGLRSRLQVASMSDKSSLDADKGSVGSAFKPDGAVGGKAQEVGGPFDKDGAVGKQFKESGAIGSTAQEAAETTQGDKPSAFDAQGVIGKHFNADGAIGGTAQAVGGPLSADGVIGKQFTKDGAIGGTVQDNLGEKK